MLCAHLMSVAFTVHTSFCREVSEVLTAVILHRTRQNNWGAKHVAPVSATNTTFVNLCLLNIKGKGTFLNSVVSLGLFKVLYTSRFGRPVHSNAISTSLRSIQLQCNYWRRLFFYMHPPLSIARYTFTTQ